MIAADIFAGCGLASVGLKAAGFEVQLACEWDNWAALSYRANHTQAGLFCGNLFLVKPVLVFPEFGFNQNTRGLIWSSPPCQSQSRSGLRRGEQDVRSKLLFWPLEAAELLKSAWVVIENTGLLESRNHLLLARLLNGFRQAGRRVAIWILDAKDFDLGHGPCAATRKRNFIVTASAPTVVGARQTMIHPELARSLTVGELRRLVGVPEYYFLAGPIEERIKQVGNSCGPVLSEVVARAIISAEKTL